MKVDLNQIVLDENGEPMPVTDANGLPVASGEKVTLRRLLMQTLLRPIEADQRRDLNTALDAYILQADLKAAGDTIELDSKQVDMLADRASHAFWNSSFIVGRIVEALDPVRINKRRPSAPASTEEAA